MKLPKSEVVELSTWIQENPNGDHQLAVKNSFDCQDPLGRPMKGIHVVVGKPGHYPVDVFATQFAGQQTFHQQASDDHLRADQATRQFGFAQSRLFESLGLSGRQPQPSTPSGQAQSSSLPSHWFLPPVAPPLSANAPSTASPFSAKAPSTVSSVGSVPLTPGLPALPSPGLAQPGTPGMPAQGLKRERDASDLDELEEALAGFRMMCPPAPDRGTKDKAGEAGVAKKIKLTSLEELRKAADEMLAEQADIQSQFESIGSAEEATEVAQKIAAPFAEAKKVCKALARLGGEGAEGVSRSLGPYEQQLLGMDGFLKAVSSKKPALAKITEFADKLIECQTRVPSPWASECAKFRVEAASDKAEWKTVADGFGKMQPWKSETPDLFNRLLQRTLRGSKGNSIQEGKKRVAGFAAAVAGVVDVFPETIKSKLLFLDLLANVSERVRSMPDAEVAIREAFAKMSGEFATFERSLRVFPVGRALLEEFTAVASEISDHSERATMGDELLRLVAEAQMEDDSLPVIVDENGQLVESGVQQCLLKAKAYLKAYAEKPAGSSGSDAVTAAITTFQARAWRRASAWLNQLRCSVLTLVNEKDGRATFLCLIEEDSSTMTNVTSLSIFATRIAAFISSVVKSLSHERMPWGEFGQGEHKQALLLQATMQFYMAASEATSVGDGETALKARVKALADGRKSMQKHLEECCTEGEWKDGAVQLRDHSNLLDEVQS